MSSELVATSDIPFGDPGRGVYAFRKGQTVPAHLVEEHGWQDFVSGAGTKSGQQAQTEASGVQPSATTTGKKG
ncbi:hypothetical protein M2302_000267 [Micromonospora sp. A200]|uniref:hypothetical protein n=1 Tax=Micromonospora sp. A200 TaxID=2940568 RepID=UPI00247570DA|nr:hypothetical protein [Micromonospora sp. A200]MDH6460116.1 hypothetical protein [Micromonospora sp. A200]